jgi:hypothetical protein
MCSQEQKWKIFLLHNHTLIYITKILELEVTSRLNTPKIEFSELNIFQSNNKTGKICDHNSSTKLQQVLYVFIKTFVMSALRMLAIPSQNART